MPKPKYIVCCDSTSHDRTSNLLSLFSILEGFKITRVRVPGAEPEPYKGDPSALLPLELCCVATWERTEGESCEDEFEHEMTVEFPGAGKQTVTGGTFVISKRLQRFVATIVAPGLPLRSTLQSGDVIVRSRVTTADGQQEWVQEFTLPLELIEETGDDLAADQISPRCSTAEHLGQSIFSEPRLVHPSENNRSASRSVHLETGPLRSSEASSQQPSQQHRRKQ
jgi:hypothetical protein